MQKYDIADIQFNHNFWLNMVVLFIIFGERSAEYDMFSA